jgi:AraC family transcriptional regulator, regulatory protein of adaptative response / methylated-DNA-[protein]-cysteine methyltransferase
MNATMIETTAVSLPSRPEMLAAFSGRDASYEGIFVTGVRTTGIFCRPTCAAKKPRPEHVEFFPSPRDALFAGYRPCKRCRPLEPAGIAPAWLRELLSAVEADPGRRWTDGDLRELGLEPDRVRRWFKENHGMTFHAYTRARRLGLALSRIQGGDKVIDAAFDHGFESLSGFNEAFRRLAGVAPTGAASGPRIVVRRLLSPLGPMIAAATEEGLCLLEFADRRMLPLQLRRMKERSGGTVVPGDNGVLAALERELGEYFAGGRRDFSVPLAAPGTPWQERVWERLLGIPWGGTVTYGELAAAMGRPTASRAVARAVGDNRIAILVPCHRVVGSGGALTGYGGGLWRKRRLLEIEGALY